jgi:hypothetical protein
VDIGSDEVRSVGKNEIRAGHGHDNPKTKETPSIKRANRVPPRYFTVWITRKRARARPTIKTASINHFMKSGSLELLTKEAYAQMFACVTSRWRSHGDAGAALFEPKGDHLKMCNIAHAKMLGSHIETAKEILRTPSMTREPTDAKVSQKGYSNNRVRDRAHPVRLA